MKRLSFSLAGAATVVAVAVGMAGCGDTSGDDDGALDVAISSDVTSLDPQLQGDMVSMSVASNIFDTLTSRANDGTLKPSVAKSWKQVGSKTWQFDLRKGISFQNGEKLDADDVVFSMNRLLDPATKSPIVELASVKKAVKVSDYRVKFQMKKPDPAVPAKVSLFGGVVLPKDLIEKEGAKKFASNPVGSGPFSFVSRTQGSEISLKANDKYWNGRPKVPKLNFKIMPDAASSLSSLQSGEIDAVTGLTTDAAKQLDGDDNVKVQAPEGTKTYFVNMDTLSDGPLHDKRVRQALNYALDKKTLIDTIQGGDAKQVATLLASKIDGVDKKVPAYGYDVAKAKQLLAAAGYKNGFSTTLNASADDSSLAQAIAGDLKKIGVNVNVKTQDFQTYRDQIASLAKRHDKGMALTSQSGWTLDASSIWQSHIASDRRSSRFHNGTADKLVVAAETATSKPTRQKSLDELQELLHDQAPFLYMYSVSNVYATRSNVQWTMPITGALDMKTATMG